MNKLLLPLLLFSLPVLATPPAAVNTCIACHGITGLSSVEQFPNLAGQKRLYLKNQLELFKSSKRQDPSGAMNGIAGGLSSEEIEQISIYYSSLKTDR